MILGECFSDVGDAVRLPSFCSGLTFFRYAVFLQASSTAFGAPHHIVSWLEPPGRVRSILGIFSMIWVSAVATVAANAGKLKLHNEKF
jgi:hypothetical protein